MGNSFSQKKDILLSPQSLSQTILDDKIWLDVTEENLFNDSFTNEKYYLLHARDEANNRNGGFRNVRFMMSIIEFFYFFEFWVF